MGPIAENDEFWRKLYNIWLKTADINLDEIKLGLFRVDYMLERDENGNETPFLVEFNTIASGAGALCCGVTNMHHALDIKPYNVTNSELGFHSVKPYPIEDVGETARGQWPKKTLVTRIKTLLSNTRIMRLIMF